MGSKKLGRIKNTITKYAMKMKAVNQQISIIFILRLIAGVRTGNRNVVLAINRDMRVSYRILGQRQNGLLTRSGCMFRKEGK